MTTYAINILAEPLLTPEEAAGILGVRPATLATWRHNRRYPLPYVKIGRLVRYVPAHMRAFMEQFREPVAA